MHRRRRYRLVQALTLPSSAAVAIAAGLLYCWQGMHICSATASCIWVCISACLHAHAVYRIHGSGGDGDEVAAVAAMAAVLYSCSSFCCSCCSSDCCSCNCYCYSCCVSAILMLMLVLLLMLVLVLVLMLLGACCAK